MNLLNKSLEIAGGVDNTPTIVRRPSRDYNPSSGFNKLKALNIHNRSGKITLDGTASTSSAASKAPENFFRDRSTIENSKLTASSLVNFEVSRYSIGALGALLAYLQNGIARSKEPEQRGLFVNKVEMIKPQKFMHLGQDALQSLQIFDQEAHANLHFSATKEGLSLFGILNECITLNGKLLLKNWLLRPSTEVKVIQSRADQIECFLDPKNADCTGKIRQDLKLMGNLGRIIKVILSGKSQVGEWVSLLSSIQACQAIRQDFSRFNISIKTPLFVKVSICNKVWEWVISHSIHVNF